MFQLFSLLDVVINATPPLLDLMPQDLSQLVQDRLKSVQIYRDYLNTVNANTVNINEFKGLSLTELNALRETLRAVATYIENRIDEIFARIEATTEGNLASTIQDANALISK